jgi:hypothetical protein
MSVLATAISAKLGRDGKVRLIAIAQESRPLDIQTLTGYR